MKPADSPRLVPDGQAIDGYALARHMGILERPFLVDFDLQTAPWSWRKNRYSARQLAALWTERLKGPGVHPDYPVGLYLHVPFCTHTCSFCRCFRMQLKSGRSLLDRYADYLCAQMEFFAPVFAGIPIKYFSVGGGTPSILTAGHWRRIFSHLYGLYDVRPGCPLSTFEMSIPTMRDEMLDVLAEFGVPRVSAGVQTLSPEIRKASRMFAITPELLAERVARAKRAGLRINLDLVLGLPGETPARFLEGFKTLLSTAPSSVCVNILNRNHFDPEPEMPGTARYLELTGAGMAEAAAEAGYSIHPHGNHMEAVLFLSPEFTPTAREHREVFKRLASGVLSVKAGTSVFAFGSVCSQALLPDDLISCFDQDYEFDPDKIVYQCSRKEVFSILYPKAEDVGPCFTAAQLKSLKPVLARLSAVPGLEVMPSLEDVLLEFPDGRQEDKRGRVFIRPYAPGKPCCKRAGPFAIAYNGEGSAATLKLVEAVARRLA